MEQAPAELPFPSLLQMVTRLPLRHLCSWEATYQVSAARCSMDTGAVKRTGMRFGLLPALVLLQICGTWGRSRARNRAFRLKPRAFPFALLEGGITKGSLSFPCLLSPYLPPLSLPNLRSLARRHYLDTLSAGSPSVRLSK